MNRLLVSGLVVAGLLLMQGQGRAQLLGVTVCGKTVGIGVSSAPAGVGYGYGYTYGAAPAAHCCSLGHGYSAPAFGYAYAVPAYGGSSCHGGLGMAYGAPAYGTSCHGGFGMAYGAPTYGTSCTGGGYGLGYGGPVVGVHYHPSGAVVGVSPPNQNLGVPGPIIHWDPSNDRNIPHLGSKPTSKLESTTGAGRDDFAALMADIDRAQAARPPRTERVAAPESKPSAAFDAILTDIDRAQAGRTPSHRTGVAFTPRRTRSGSE